MAPLSPTTLPAATPARHIGKRVVAAAMLGLAAAGSGIEVYRGTHGPALGVVSMVGADLSHLYLTSEQEAFMGRVGQAQLESAIPQWNNPQAQARLDRLGKLLQSDSLGHKTYRFKLLDTPKLNALSAPPDTITLTRGLYELFPDDNQLLFLMGHEMTHLEARHVVKKVWSHDLETARYYESEADKGGLNHLKHLGINPWHAVFAMQRLETAEICAPPSTSPDVKPDHPETAKRVLDLKKLAAGYPIPAHQDTPINCESVAAGILEI